MADRDTAKTDRARADTAAEISAAEAGRAGMTHIAELTGKDLESVIGVEPTEEGWRVCVEVIEDHRVPSSTDILATYEIDLGPVGELISYHRDSRYSRGDSYDRGNHNSGGNGLPSPGR